MTDRCERMMKAKERLDKATKAYASAQTEFIQAQREARDVWREYTSELSNGES
jgi:hypothetical protein